MGGKDAPQWLLSAFVRACKGAGATADRDEVEATALRLLDRWAEPGRVHHNIRHLVDVLAKVDELAPETHDPDLVRLAAWYHGAVFSSNPANSYAHRGGEDEVASGNLAGSELLALGIPEESVDRVQEIVTSIAGHHGGKDVDIQALCDAELGTLAGEPQRYAAYRRDVRAEYAHLPIRDYLTARIAILTKLLSRKRIFSSPLGLGWEDPARQNLRAELKRLESELAALAEDEPVDDETEPADGEQPAGEESAGAAKTPTKPKLAGQGRTTRLVKRTPISERLGQATAEEVAAVHDTGPIVKRHERTARRAPKLDLPGRS